MQIILKNNDGEELLNQTCFFLLGTIAILDKDPSECTSQTFCVGQVDTTSGQLGLMKMGLKDILEAYQKFFVPLGDVINREDEILNLISQLRNLLDYQQKTVDLKVNEYAH